MQTNEERKWEHRENVESKPQNSRGDESKPIISPMFQLVIGDSHKTYPLVPGVDDVPWERLVETV